MQIVEPYARIVIPPYSCIPDGELTPDSLKRYGIELLRHVEWAARVSHRSEEHQGPGTWHRLISSVVLQHGDWSVTEHAVVTVEALVDRGITHEWVRHRIGAYTQESTRFVNYARKMPPSFIMPQEFGQSEDNPAGGDVWWNKATETAEDCYQHLVADGVSPQIARSVFPTALASKLIVTYSLRSWRHFFLMRTSREAHPQMRQVTIPLLAEFKATIPLLYDDIEPEQRQADNMRKMR